MGLKRSLAIKLRATRKARRLTQDGLAGLVDRSIDAISNIERGKGLPSLATLEAIATQLDIPIAEFFDKPKSRWAGFLPVSKPLTLAGLGRVVPPGVLFLTRVARSVRTTGTA